MYAGVDWARKGWFAVFLTADGGCEGDFYPTLWNLWRDQGDDINRMLVDIPIGLCEDTKRACDVAAKAYIGPRQQSSRFYTPIREAVYAQNIDLGKERHRGADTDFSIQNQAWGLVPRIREADAFVEDCDASSKVLETHPECCFVALNDHEHLSNSKKTEEGIEERLQLLDSATEIDVREFYEDARSIFREPSYAPVIGDKDDIVDALVAAVSAAFTEEELPSLPRDAEPDYDDHLGRKIEFKRDRSPRSAVTQLFDYASSLARLDQDEFFDLTKFESLEELYEAFDHEEDSEFDIDDFERKFAEGLESPQLMLVAYTVTDDVRRMTRWLRDAHDLKINCVEFDYYERDDAEMFVPTVIGADETQEIKEREESPKQKKYRRFFGEVLERFKEELPGVTSRSASSDSWLTIPTGHSNVEFVWHFKGDPGDKEFHVVMNFQFDDSRRNEELLETMLAAIEDRSLDVPEEIHSEEYGNSGYTRLYVKREVSRLDDALEDEELKEWAVDRLAEFYKQLTPVLDEELR